VVPDTSRKMSGTSYLVMQCYGTEWLPHVLWMCCIQKAR